MGCNSAIYCINSFTTAVEANQTVPLTSVIRKFGKAISLANYGVRINAIGYYQIDANITLEPTATGQVTISLYKDGVLIPGATASTQSYAAGSPISVSLTALIRQTCCADASTITIVTSAAGDVTNAAMVVKRL